MGEWVWLTSGCGYWCYRPAGVFEIDKFANGSKSILDAMVTATSNGVTTIIGITIFAIMLVNKY